MNPNTSEAQFVQPIVKSGPEAFAPPPPIAEAPVQTTTIPNYAPITESPPAQPVPPSEFRAVDMGGKGNLDSVTQSFEAPPPIPEEFVTHAGQPAAEIPSAPPTIPDTQIAQPTAAVQPAPEAVQPPTFNAEPRVAPSPAFTPEVVPAPPPYSIPEARATAQAMAPNLGPDVATAARDAEVLATMAIPKAEIDDIKGNKIGVPSPEPVLVGIDPNAEKSAETQNLDTEIELSLEMQKKLAGSIMSSQYLLEEMQKNSNPKIVAMADEVAKQTLINTATNIITPDETVEDQKSWSE